MSPTKKATPKKAAAKRITTPKRSKAPARKTAKKLVTLLSTWFAARGMTWQRERFIFYGKRVADTVLFYWSIVSISRALRFNAEAQHQKAGSYVLATVAGYYALFHLGMF